MCSSDLGMPARQVNPFKLRQFARASGVLAKNDPLDARMIASFVAIMPTQPAQPRALGRPSFRSAQWADRTVATALIDLAESRP